MPSATTRPSRGWCEDVDAPGQDQRRDGDLAQAARRVVGDERLQLGLECLRRLRVRIGQCFVDDLGDGAVVVGPGGVDPHEEGFEHGPLARGHVSQPAQEVGHRSGVAVEAGPRADQDQAAHQLGMADGQLLGDLAAARESGDVGAGHTRGSQDGGGVVGHPLD
jgi:hypothetical protein